MEWFFNHFLLPGWALESLPGRPFLPCLLVYFSLSLSLSLTHTHTHTHTHRAAEEHKSLRLPGRQGWGWGSRDDRRGEEVKAEPLDLQVGRPELLHHLETRKKPLAFVLSHTEPNKQRQGLNLYGYFIQMAGNLRRWRVHTLMDHLKFHFKMALFTRRTKCR